MKKAMIPLLLVLALLVFAGCSRTPQQKADWMTDHIADDLDLTAVQKGKLDKVKTAMLEIRREDLSKRKQFADEMNTLILSDFLEEDAVTALGSQRHENFKGYFAKVFPLIQDFHASLSKEQKQNVVEKMKRYFQVPKE